MERPLDRIDCEILRALQNHARLSNKELAARVKLAPSSCLERVRRLTQEGRLIGFHAEVDPKSVGIGLQAMIMVRLKQHSRQAVASFRKHVLQMPEAVDFFHLAGEHDFLVQVAARDADHLRDLAMDAFTTRPEVSQIETALIFEHVRSKELPFYNAAP